MLNSAIDDTNCIGGFVFGYPHLLPKLQGNELRKIFEHVVEKIKRCILCLDLNGVTLGSYSVISSVIPLVDILHLNNEELNLILPEIRGDVEEKAKEIIKRGAAIVCVTLGDKGCVVTCGDDERFAKVSGRYKVVL